jgi:hypothetical protein
VGSIGPVQNGAHVFFAYSSHDICLFIVRMLLKYGYRHVYIFRKFATKHAFIPADAMPGTMVTAGLSTSGYGPQHSPPIPLRPTNTLQRLAPGSHKRQKKSRLVQVYLSVEPYFDVVLGRSFIEKRQIQLIRPMWFAWTDKCNSSCSVVLQQSDVAYIISSHAQ